MNNRLKNHDNFIRELISGMSTIQEYHDKVHEALRVSYNTKMHTDYVALEMNAYNEMEKAIHYTDVVKQKTMVEVKTMLDAKKLEIVNEI